MLGIGHTFEDGRGRARLAWLLPLRTVRLERDVLRREVSCGRHPQPVDRLIVAERAAYRDHAAHAEERPEQLRARCGEHAAATLPRPDHHGDGLRVATRAAHLRGRRGVIALGKRGACPRAQRARRGVAVSREALEAALLAIGGQAQLRDRLVPLRGHVGTGQGLRQLERRHGLAPR